MKINVCVPTRGKRKYLEEYIPLLVKRSYLPDTRIVIGFDEDDVEGFIRFDDEKVIHSVRPREDSLGAKYNRCALEYSADLYMMWVDDIEILTDGWDIMLDATANVGMLPDGIGVFTFGKEPNGEMLPSGMAITRKVIETMGFMAPPYFPFWWHNTWVHEVAEMAARLIPVVGLQTKYPKVLPASPRRDIAFWGKFFDEMRWMRRETAVELIDASDDQPWRKHLYTLRLNNLMKIQEMRNSRTRDSSFEAVINAIGANVPEEVDDRHRRLRERAEGLMSKGALVAPTNAQLEMELAR